MKTKRILLALHVMLVTASPVLAKKRPLPSSVAAPVVPTSAAAPVEGSVPAETPPAPTPKAETPSAESPPASTTPLDEFRREYDAIRDELFRSRARIGAVGEAVFKTKLIVDVVYRAQRDWPLKRVVVLLDDKQVFAAEHPNAAKPLRAFDSFAGMGRHHLSVTVESVRPEGRVGYTATGVFAIDVVDGKQTRVTVTGDETGDGPEQLTKRRQGGYDVRIRADIKSEALGAR